MGKIKQKNKQAKRARKAGGMQEMATSLPGQVSPKQHVAVVNNLNLVSARLVGADTLYLYFYLPTEHGEYSQSPPKSKDDVL